MKAFFRFESVKKRMLLSFMIVVILPLAVGVGGYLWTARIAETQASQTYVNMLDQARDSVDGVFSRIDSLADTLKDAKWISKIANMTGDTIDETRMSAFELSIYPDEINNYRSSMNGYVDTIGVIINQKNLVITKNGIDDLDWFFKNTYEAKGFNEDKWNKILSARNERTILYPMDIFEYRVNERIPKSSKMFTYIKTLDLPFKGSVIDLSRTPKATLLISISEDAIKRPLENVAQGSGSSLYIFDGSNSPVTGINPRPEFEKQLAGRKLDDTGIINVKDSSGVPYYAFSAASRPDTANTWKYVAIIPKSIVLGYVNYIKYATMLLFFLCTLASLILAYSLFRSNYKPLKVIVNKLSSEAANNENTVNCKNEYNLIERAYDSVVANKNELQEKVQLYLPMAEHSFFIRLLYNVISHEEVEAVEKTIGIGAGEGQWSVAVVYCEKGGSSEPSIRQKVSQWVMEGNRPLYVIEIENTRFALILNTSDKKIIRESVSTVLDNLSPGRGTKAFVGVGTHCSQLEGISLSYKEAIMAVNYAFFKDNGGKSSVFFEEVNADGKFNFYFPHAREEELLNKVRMGEFEPVREILEFLLDKNTGSGNTSFISRQCFFYSLLSTALKVVSDTDMEIQSLVNEREFMLLDSVSGMKDYIYDVYGKICAAMSYKREGHCLKVRSIMLKYIDDSCLDENITLQLVAEKFNVSIPYLSKFIKEQTGLNFVDYIGRKRISKAKDMLEDDNISIESIGKSVGYINPLTFRRAFKKYEGINPGDYREAAGKAQGRNGYRDEII